MAEIKSNNPDTADLLTRSLAAASDGVVILATDWRVLYANDAAQQMIPGFFITGHGLWNRLDDPAIEPFRRRFRQVIQDGVSREFEEFSPEMNQWLQMHACPVEAGVMVCFRPIDRHLHLKQEADETLSRFWSMFEYLPEAVTVADPRGMILGGNRATMELFGFGDESELKQSISAFDNFEISDLDGNVLPVERWPLSRVMSGETFSDYRVRFRRTDTGRSIIGSCAGSPVRNPAGQIILTVVTVRDITRQLAAEQALAANEAFYRSLDDFLPQLMWILDNDGTMRHANRSFMRFSGLTPKKLNDDGFALLIHPEEFDRRNQIVRHCMTTGGTGEMEVRFRRADGQYRWMLARWGPVRDGLGNITQWMGTATDIHDWKRNELALRQTMESLRQSELRFAAFMDHSPAMAWINDEHGRLLYMNRFHRQVLDYENKTKPVKTIWDIFPKEQADDYQRLNLEVINTGEESQQITAVNHAGRGDVTHLIFRFPLESDGKTLAAGLGIDISEQQRIQDELRQAKEAAESANAAKDHFLAILSHELRTPLTPVLLFSSAMEKNPDLPDEVREDMKLIRRQIQLEARLIDDLLDLTRIQRGKFLLTLAPISVHEVLRRVVGLAKGDVDENGLKLSLDLSAESDQMQGDYIRLQQLFANLLGNAIKFTPSGGSVSIRTRNQNESLIVEVADTGVGIPPEIMDRLFNAFEQGERSITRRYGGLGLGLTIGKAVAEHHFGTIEAASEGAGRGAMLRVTLPIITAPAQSDPPPPRPETAAGKQRVLLVEDHDATREMLERLLRRIGYDVLPADSVAAAARLGDREPFDLLLCDIGLPDGTGLDVIARLKQTGRTFRAVALSGYGTDQDIARSLAAGFERHLVKPVDLQQLQSAFSVSA